MEVNGAPELLCFPHSSRRYVGVGDMTKILYHDMKKFISRYSVFFPFKKVFIILKSLMHIIFIIIVTNVNIKLIQA